MMHFEDGTTQEVRLPAEAWRVDSTKFSKMVVTEKKVVRFELDPHRETADADRNNNYFPPELEPTRFEVFKGGGGMGGRGGRRMAAGGGEAPVGNPMRDARRNTERQRQGDAAPNANGASVNEPAPAAAGEKKEPEAKEGEKKAETEKKEEAQPAEQQAQPAASGGV
jgi:hypothetical protein